MDEHNEVRSLPGKLQGKIALITGGNSGIGLATARQFVNEGASVLITGRRQSQLTAAVKEIGRHASSFQGDVSNLDDLDRLFARIKQEKGKLDIVFANTGVAKYARLDEITEDLYERIFDINVKGMLFTVQKALPLMPDGASNHPHIVHCRKQGIGREQCLCRYQGGRTLFRADLDYRLEASPDSRERNQPGLDRHARTERSAGVFASGRGGWRFRTSLESTTHKGSTPGD
jgi:short chain dehydrogenase